MAKSFAEGHPCLRISDVTWSVRALVIAVSMADTHRWTYDLEFFGAPAVEFPTEAEIFGARRRTLRRPKYQRARRLHRSPT